MSQFKELLQEGTRSGVKKGWDGFIWMLKIIVPISFFTALLSWSGWLNQMEFILQPLMRMISLPPMAALPIIMGMLVGIYGTIAAMAILPFTQAEMTLIAIFVLMAHNLIQEGIIQAQSGIHPLKATLFRLIPAAITVNIVAALMGYSPVSIPHDAAVVTHRLSFIQVMQNWAMETLQLIALIFVIIMILMITLDCLKSLGWIQKIVRGFSPFLRIMGLNQQMAILWMTAIVFGLAYGGAVIVEEVKNGQLSQGELETLHLSIGMNHALIEDPLYFVALGVNPLWLYVPRIVTAILTVHLIRLWRRFVNPRFVRT